MKKFFFLEKLSMFDLVSICLIARMLGDGYWFAAFIVLAGATFVSHHCNIKNAEPFSEVKSNG